MKIIQLEAKTLEDAKLQAVLELRVPAEHIEVTVLEKKGLLRKVLVCEAKVTKDPAEVGYEIWGKYFLDLC